MVTAVAPIATSTITTQNSMSAQHHGSNSIDLESLIDSPASSADMSTFHANVQNSILQNNMMTTDVDSSFSAKPAKNIIMEMVDGLQNSRKKTLDMASHFSELSPSDAVELQETAESYYVTTQFLSKVVSTAAKQVDTLVHTQ